MSKVLLYIFQYLKMFNLFKSTLFITFYERETLFNDALLARAIRIANVSQIDKSLHNFLICTVSYDFLL